MEFVVPQYTDDLEVPVEGKFYVHKVLDVENCDDIDEVLSNVSSIVQSASPISSVILEHDVFDILYSVTKFWQFHSTSTKRRIVELFITIVQDVVREANRVVVPPNGRLEMNRTERQRLAAVTGISYMFNILIQVIEKNIAAVDTTLFAVKTKKTKAPLKSKGSRKKGDLDENDDEKMNNEEGSSAENDFGWDELCDISIELLRDLLSIDSRKLWPQGVVINDFVMTFAKTGLRIMTYPTRMKVKSVKQNILTLVAFTTAKFSSTISLTIAALADSLTKFDHVVGCSLILIETWGTPTSPYYTPRVVGDFLRELSRLSSLDTKDTAGFKRISSLLQDLSAKLPTIASSNIFMLLPQLDSDSYALRNALLSMIGNVLAERIPLSLPSFKKNEEDAEDPQAQEQEAAKVRDALVVALFERCFDVHAITRSVALQSARTVVVNMSLPVSHVRMALETTIDRVSDKSAHVRRSALRLLRALVENNPFGPQLDPSVFQRQLTSVEKALQTQFADVWQRILKDEGIEKGTDASKGSSEQKSKKKGDKKAVNHEKSDDEEEDENSEETRGKPSQEVLDTKEEPVFVSPAAAKLANARQMLRNALAFAQALVGAVPALERLISSRTASDTTEAVRVLACARTFGVPGAQAALGAMLSLVWGETSVKAEALRTFHLIFIRNAMLDDEGEGDSDALALSNDAAAAVDAAEAKESADMVDSEEPTQTTEKKQKRAARGKKAQQEDEEEDEDEDMGEPVAAVSKAVPKPEEKKKKSTSSSSAASASATAYTYPVDDVDPAKAAANLMKLLDAASAGTRASVEEAIKQLLLLGAIPPAVFICLWDLVAAATAQHARVRALWAVWVASHQDGTPENGETVPAELLSAARTASEALVLGRRALAILAMTPLAETQSDVEVLARLAPVLLPLQPSLSPSCSGTSKGNSEKSDSISSERTLPNGPGVLQGLSDKVLAQLPPLLVDLVVNAGDYVMASHACAALQKFLQYRRLRGGIGGFGPAQGFMTPAESAYLASEVRIVRGLAALVASEWDAHEQGFSLLKSEGKDTLVVNGPLYNGHYFAAAQGAIDCMFAAGADARALAIKVLQKMVQQALHSARGAISPQPTESADSAHVLFGRFLFVLGHTALCAAVQSEQLAGRLRSLRSVVVDVSADNSRKTEESAAAESKSKAKGKSKEKEKGKEKEMDEAALSAQLGGGDEELELEYLERRNEADIVASGVAKLFTPVLSHLSLALGTPAAPAGSAAEQAALAAVLSLCKLMACSYEVCETHISLVFTVLERCGGVGARCTLLVALGDLAERFPNVLEPFTSRMYAPLEDAHADVRLTAILVITHLVLNDMVKMHGRIGTIAMRLQDPDPRIAGHTRVFFTELAKRQNSPIFNYMPEILLYLSGVSGEGLTQAQLATRPVVWGVTALDGAALREAASFLFSFIAKEQLADGYIEKILLKVAEVCRRSDIVSSAADKSKPVKEKMTYNQKADVGLRLTPAQELIQARRLCFCASLLQPSPKMIAKLKALVEPLQLALADDDIFAQVNAIAQKLLKSVSGSAASTAGKEDLSLQQNAQELVDALAAARSAAAENAELMRAAKKDLLQVKYVLGAAAANANQGDTSVEALRAQAIRSVEESKEHERELELERKRAKREENKLKAKSKPKAKPKKKREEEEEDDDDDF